MRLLSLVAGLAGMFAAAAPAAQAPDAQAPARQAQEAPAPEAPAAQEAPTQEAPAQEAPAQEAPVQEAPVQEAPVLETPAPEALVQETPAQEAPAQEAPAPEAPVQDAPAPEAPAQAPPATPAPAPATQAPAPRPAPVVPPPALEAENIWNLDLSTGGRVVIQLRPDAAPAHVERIRALTRQGFYDGVVFHRVIEGFMAQSGDPTGTGGGGSPLPDLNAEINGLPHVRGAVAAARAQEMNSANSQFYIMFVPRLNMDRNYTVFGRVVGGMNYVDAIERGEPPLSPSRVVRASIGSDNVPPMTAEQLAAAAAAAAQTSTVPRTAAVGPAVPPPPPPPRQLEPVRGPERGRPPR